MATLPGSTSAYNLLEAAKRKDPNGDSASIAEVLTEVNEMLLDAPWFPSNDTFAHKVVRRLSNPLGTWRKLNQGVATEASRTVEAWETIGMLESYSEIDQKIIDTSPSPQQARMDEARSFLEGMGQHLADTLIYGNSAASDLSGVDAGAYAPEEFTGFAARMNSLATTNNVLNAGGSGSDVTSVFVVQWGRNQVFMIYPKDGAPNAGIQHEDLGIQTVSTAVGSNKNSTAQFQAYRDHFIVNAGLVVKDPRCIGRIANIESTGSTNIFDEDDLITLLIRMKNGGKGASIYVNKTVMTQMQIALKDKNNVYYTSAGGEGLAGEPVVRFMGHPVRQMDSIAITEAALS
jgi:hypothetical protein